MKRKLYDMRNRPVGETVADGGRGRGELGSNRLAGSEPIFNYTQKPRERKKLGEKDNGKPPAPRSEPPKTTIIVQCETRKGVT